jgi:hypothetical protein
MEGEGNDCALVTMVEILLVFVVRQALLRYSDAHGVVKAKRIKVYEMAHVI